MFPPFTFPLCFWKFHLLLMKRCIASDILVCGEWVIEDVCFGSHVILMLSDWDKVRNNGQAVVLFITHSKVLTSLWTCWSYSLSIIILDHVFFFPFLFFFFFFFHFAWFVVSTVLRLMDSISSVFVFLWQIKSTEAFSLKNGQGSV